MATITSLARELNPKRVGEHIYCHPQTNCFVRSELFSVARQARFPKLGSKHWPEYDQENLIHEILWGFVLPQHWRFPRPKGTVPKAFTPLRRVGFIAWRLRRPYYGKSRRGWRYFRQCRTRVGCGPATGPTLKTTLCQTRLFDGARDR